MKHLANTLIVLTCLVLVSTLAARAQGATELVNEALKNADAVALSEHFNSSLDISLPDMDQTMSKSHATQVMKDFFRDNPPKNFKVNHTGSSRESTKYIIGTYTSGSKSYKTYALLKEKEGKFLIVQLQFELE